MNSISSWTSVLFLTPNKISHLNELNASAYILDLQDAVPQGLKAQVRMKIQEADDQGKFKDIPLVIRINELAKLAELKLDIELVSSLKHVYAVIPTMIKTLDDLNAIGAMFAEAEGDSAPVPFIPLMETPGAILNCESIASYHRNIGLFLGMEDLLRTVGARRVPEAFITPRNLVVYAAKLYGLTAIDTPLMRLSDPLELRDQAKLARSHGFTVKSCIHPSHVDIINQEMSVSKLEYTAAKALLYNDVDCGIVVNEGTAYGPPHIKNAKNIVDSYKGLTDEDIKR